MVANIEDEVMHNGLALRDLPPQPDNINALALQHFPWGIQYIKNPSEQLQIIAVTSDPFVEIESISPAALVLQESMLLARITKTWSLIQYCPRDYLSVQMRACELSKDAYNLIENPKLPVKLAYG